MLARQWGEMMFFFCSLTCAAQAELGRRRNARRPVSRVLSRPLAGPWMTIPLGRPLPDASRDLPGRRRENPPGDGLSAGSPVAPMRSCSRWGLPCRCRRRQRGALLPHPFTLTGGRVSRRAPAVCSLWHFPWGRPRRVLPGTVFPWSPDFPPLGPEGSRSGHPAVWPLLARRLRASRQQNRQPRR